MKIKSILLACVGVLMLSSAFGQTEKGHFLIGSDLPFSARFNNGAGVSLDARFGYFLMDNFALGALLGVDASDGNTGYAVGPLARYYFTTGNAKLKPFGQLFLGIGGYSGNYSSSSGLVGNVAGGVAFFLNQHVALEPALQIDIDSRDNGQSGTLSLNLGIQVYLP